jgi:hypothetical protein
MQMEVLHPTTFPKAVALFIKEKVTYMLNHQWVTGEARDILEHQYMIGICNAMMALGPEVLREFLTGRKRLNTEDLWLSRDLKPSLAAAVGDLDMLRGSLLLTDLLPPHCGMFPNALEASIAADQKETLHVILDWLVTNVRGKHETGSWDEMRGATRTITDALRVAVKLHKTETADQLLKFLADNVAFRKSTNLYFETNLVKDCMRHGRADMLHSALLYKRKHYEGITDSDKLANFKITEEEEKFLFRHGHFLALRGLIKRGLLDPNHCQDSTPPVFRLLDNRSYELVHELFKLGADVDATDKTKIKETALSHAAAMGHITDVEILLKYGADPVRRGVLGTPLDRASGHKKCRFLLEKVHRYGKEYLDREDLWDIYDNENQRDDGWW